MTVQSNTHGPSTLDLTLATQITERPQKPGMMSVASVNELTFCSRLNVFSSRRCRHRRAACLFLTLLTSLFSRSAGDNSLSAIFAFLPGLFFDKGRNFEVDLSSNGTFLLK